MKVELSVTGCRTGFRAIRYSDEVRNLGGMHVVDRVRLHRPRRCLSRRTKSLVRKMRRWTVTEEFGERLYNAQLNLMIFGSATI